MRVLVAGSTGAIGVPLTKALLAAGHQVIGLTRSSDGARILAAIGAESVIADAFHLDALRDAVRDARPEVVIEQMTALPKANTPENRRLTASLHSRTRREAGANLQMAALEAGVRRYIAQSSAFWSASGLGLAGESDSLAVTGASPGVTGGAKTLDVLERRVLAASDVEGVILRYGFFYGPGTWYSREGSAAEAARSGHLPVIGDGTGVWSFIHVDDAAAATVAAIERGARGLYQVVDDDPSPLSAWLPAFCRYVGAPHPPHVNAVDAQRRFGEDAVYYAIRLRGASNSKAKRDLGFRPRRLEWMHSQ